MITPPATLGVLGGGQLGRMFTHAAQTLGYRVAVLDPDRFSPAGSVAEHHVCAAYTDVAGLDEFAGLCAAATTEFENVPAASLRRLARQIPVSPAAAAVEVAQNRNREKAFFADCGVATVRSSPVQDGSEIGRAVAAVGLPGVLKTAELGYDGKGQSLVETERDVRDAFAGAGAVACILEQRVDLACEVSVLVARNALGDTAVYPVAENRHRDGILHISLAPARIGEAQAEAARQAARRLADELDYRGVLAVEFFLTRDGRLLANEMAPRPHNSGHYTIDACVASQFEQQVRALCGLPLGDPQLLSPVAMLNLLGDLWRAGEAPDWQRVLAEPGCRLHLYGKREARPGRKMGHVSCLAADPGRALARAEALYAALAGTP